jgi:hypothetical protein
VSPAQSSLHCVFDLSVDFNALRGRQSDKTLALHGACSLNRVISLFACKWRIQWAQQFREVILNLRPEALTSFSGQLISIVKFCRMFRCWRDVIHAKINVTSPASARLAQELPYLAK